MSQITPTGKKYDKDFIIKNAQTIEATEMNDIYAMCSHEFDIEDWINPSVAKRLTERSVMTWRCTDTYVGCKVVYLDDIPVCITWQQYRKSNVTHFWLSKDSFRKTKKYVQSLLETDDADGIQLADSYDFTPVITEAWNDNVSPGYYNSVPILQF